MESIVLVEREITERIIHLLVECLVDSVGNGVECGSFTPGRPRVESDNILVNFVRRVVRFENNSEVLVGLVELDVDDVVHGFEDPFLFELLRHLIPVCQISAAMLAFCTVCVLSEVLRI